jgi:hypothetical protein
VRRLARIEVAFMIVLVVVCAVVALALIALVFYVVRRSRPGRFRLSATLLKLVSINVEVEAQDKPGGPRRSLSGAPVK